MLDGTGNITFTRVGFPNSSWKMAAFAWPELGHQIINVVRETRFSGRDGD